MSRSIAIREGGAAEADAVASLYARSRRSAYARLVPPDALGEEHSQRELWRLRLAVDYGDPAATPVLIVAEEGGRMVGFAYLVPQPDGRVLLDNLHVRPDRTGDGIGHRLFRAALDRADGPLYLEVLGGNTRAVAFYERQGGVRTAEREAYFPGGHSLPEYEYSWAVPAGASRPRPPGANRL